MPRFCKLLFLLSLISCASKEVEQFHTSANQQKLEKKLVKDLNLDDSTFKKFEVTEVIIDNSPKVIAEKKSPVKKQKNTIPPKITKIEKVEDNDPTLANDYPPEFIKYDKKYASVWDSLTPNFKKGEIHKLNISWSLFDAGEITLETLGKVLVGQEPAFGFSANLVSAEYFESIYKLQDKLESFVSQEKFLPIKYTLSQRESGQSVDDIQLFDQKKLKMYFSFKREKKGKVTKKNEEINTPRFFLDSFSVLHFIRALDFKVGDKFSLPVMTRAKLWFLNAQVDKVEEITIMEKSVRAYKIKAETQFPGVLKKSGDIIFWYSADKAKKLLKFEAKVKIGTIKGILTEYQEGKLD